MGTSSQGATVNLPGPYTKAYPCIGGPLDGAFVFRNDFAKGFPNPPEDRPEWYSAGGKYGEYADQYLAFNANSRQTSYRKGKRGRIAPQETPSMVWLHVSLLEGRAQRTQKQLEKQEDDE